MLSVAIPSHNANYAHMVINGLLKYALAGKTTASINHSLRKPSSIRRGVGRVWGVEIAGIALCVGMGAAGVAWLRYLWDAVIESAHKSTGPLWYFYGHRRGATRFLLARRERAISNIRVSGAFAHSTFH